MLLCRVPTRNSALLHRVVLGIETCLEAATGGALQIPQISQESAGDLLETIQKLALFNTIIHPRGEKANKNLMPKNAKKLIKNLMHLLE